MFCASARIIVGVPSFKVAHQHLKVVTVGQSSPDQPRLFVLYFILQTIVEMN